MSSPADIKKDKGFFISSSPLKSICVLNGLKSLWLSLLMPLFCSCMVFRWILNQQWFFFLESVVRVDLFWSWYSRMRAAIYNSVTATSVQHHSFPIQTWTDFCFDCLCCIISLLTEAKNTYLLPVIYVFEPPPLPPTTRTYVYRNPVLKSPFTYKKKTFKW